MDNERVFCSSKEKILKYLKSVVENNTYYKKLFDDNSVVLDNDFDYEEFKKIPILTKDIYRANQEKIEKVLEGKTIVCKVTSGSTGKPFKVCRTKADNIRMNYTLNCYRNRIVSNITNKKAIYFDYMYYERVRDEVDKVSFLVTHESKNFYRFSYLYLSDEVYAACIQYINAEKPEWLLGQVSFMYNLAKYICVHGGLLHQVKYIECNSEYLGGEESNVISQAFGVKPTSMYGANEVNAIAIQCSCGNMHIMDECVFCEIEEETHDIIVTSLNNMFTPFLRYKLGDVAAWGHEECSCGFEGPIINLSGFRSNDYFIVDSERKIEMWFFSDVFKRLRDEKNINIQQYKIYQYSDGIKVLLVTGNLKKNSKYEIYDFLSKEVFYIFQREVKILVEYVDEILPDMKTGKYRFFVQMIDKKME